jgi:hypothetical protein
MDAARRECTTGPRHGPEPDQTLAELAAGWRRFLELVERIRREDAGEAVVRIERAA